MKERDYQFGDKVLFLDENQLEIRGVVRDRTEYADMTELLIELDGGGYYSAKLRKTPNAAVEARRLDHDVIRLYGGGGGE